MHGVGLGEEVEEEVINLSLHGIDQELIDLMNTFHFVLDGWIWIWKKNELEI